MTHPKPTKRGHFVQSGLAVLYALLGLFALLNVFWSMTPAVTYNEQIASRLEKAATLSVDQQSALFQTLEAEQKQALIQMPSEPYGWARLAYLQLMNRKDGKAAFEALRMSDFVSPFEPLQLPQRAVMWSMFRLIEDPSQQAYQDVLWLRAYGIDRDATWKIAMQNNLIKQVAESLKKTSPSSYEEWKARQAGLRR